VGKESLKFIWGRVYGCPRDLSLQTELKRTVLGIIGDIDSVKGLACI